MHIDMLTMIELPHHFHVSAVVSIQRDTVVGPLGHTGREILETERSLKKWWSVEVIRRVLTGIPRVESVGDASCSQSSWGIARVSLRGNTWKLRVSGCCGESR